MVRENESRGSAPRLLTIELVENSVAPVVTAYGLGLLVVRLYRTKRLANRRVTRLQKDFPSRTDITKLIDRLQKIEVLSSHGSFPNRRVYRILGKGDAEASDVACSVDPFAYVSHLSAMEYHGLTDRFARTLTISTPSARAWREFALRRMQKDLGELYERYVKARLPRLTRLSVRDISRTPIITYSSIHLGAYKNVPGRSLRVATVGRTFLDMLRAPRSCGGIRHVLDVCRQHASTYLQLLVDEIERHGTGIEKVRAGYILEEVCGLSHDALDTWLVHAQRGGSRKLDPNADYDGLRYSEKWCISLNI